MTFETEAVLDRRRLRRRLSFWRVLAVAAGVLAVGLVLFSSARRVGLIEQRQIARITVEGLITEDRDLLQLIKKVGDSRSVAGVIVSINSPGGTTAGGEALFEALRELAKRKPLVAQFGTAATSAAYMIGIATDLDRRPRQHHHRLGGRHLPVAGVHAAAGEARHQGQRDQERAAQSQPLAVPAAGRGRQGGGRENGGRIATVVPEFGAHPARASTPRGCPAWSRAAYSPVATRSRTS